MGRPPLPVGTFGRIDFHHNGEERVRARASFRDVDGVRRPVTRWGSSAQQAEARLRAALACRAGPAVGALSAQTRVTDAARVWLAQVDGSGRASGTRSLYRAAVRGYVVPAMGELRLGELTVPLIEHALAVVLSGHGSGAARTARAALSGICSMAARHGAVPTNPVRDTAPIRQGRKPVRALTVTEAADLLGRLRRDTRARRLDLPDLVEFMLATGTRIGEAAAVRDAVVDLTARTVTVNATVIRVPGSGLRLQPHPKTTAANRTLSLPAHLVALLHRRAKTRRTNPAGIVFCSPAGMIRDPSNSQADLREVLDRIGYGWVTSHTFRKTVATRLDEAGMSARQIADQLGHSRPSMTLDVYLGRQRSVNRAAAAVLDRAAAGRGFIDRKLFVSCS
jgi:integrase